MMDIQTKMNSIELKSLFPDIEDLTKFVEANEHHLPGLSAFEKLVAYIDGDQE